MKLATAEQIREMDRRAIDEFGIPSIVLMENAAIAIANEIAARIGPGRRFVAVCGIGNNGGDGIAVARHLTARFGWSGTIWLCGEPGSKSTPDRDANLEIARRMGIDVRDVSEPELGANLANADAIIDALLGTGAKGDPRQVASGAIDAINTAGRLHAVVSIDVPSGVDVDTGRAGSPAVRAAFTVTLGMSKIGLHLAPACELTGEVIVGDLCFPIQLTQGNSDVKAIRTENADVAAWLPDRMRRRDSNKSTYGTTALLAGSEGYAGAATLCCVGALRAGAGLVTLGAPQGLIDVMMARLPDEVMVRGLSDAGARQFCPEALPAALELVAKMDAVGIGPGMGAREPEVVKFAIKFIAQCAKPLVIDADALNCLASCQDRGAEIVKSRKAPTILTPHPGEMGRLLGVSSKDVQSDRLGSVRRAVERFGCVVLLKGDRTLIASPDGGLAINESGNPGMASGGMGDILTGIATAFLAQIRDPFAAAAAAAYVHGLAGDLAAGQTGRAGLVAGDLGTHVPAAIRQCRME